MGVELPWKLRVGPDIKLYHGVGLVINDGAVIGKGVILRHAVTIGTSSLYHKDSPIIGDYVDIGAGAIILGGIRIGDGVTIGAGTIVLKSIPDYAIVVGNPGRVVGFNKPS